MPDLSQGAVFCPCPDTLSPTESARTTSRRRTQIAHALTAGCDQRRRLQPLNTSTDVVGGNDVYLVYSRPWEYAGRG